MAACHVSGSSPPRPTFTTGSGANGMYSCNHSVYSASCVQPGGWPTLSAWILSTTKYRHGRQRHLCALEACWVSCSCADGLWNTASNSSIKHFGQVNQNQHSKCHIPPASSLARLRHRDQFLWRVANFSGLVTICCLRATGIACEEKRGIVEKHSDIENTAGDAEPHHWG